MSEKDVTFQYCDEIIDQFEQVCKHPIVEKSSVYYTGVDLGTACVVVAVLDENFRPVAGCYQYADVVRDGMVVDYFGAVQIIRAMKAKLEEEIKALQARISMAAPEVAAFQAAFQRVQQEFNQMLEAMGKAPAESREKLRRAVNAMVDSFCQRVENI